MTNSQEQPQLPLEGVPTERFDPDQRRAFGSVPGLIGRELTIPRFEQLDPHAFARSEPAVIQAGLLGRTDGYAVDGVVLNPEEYQTVVRGPRSFQTVIQGRTVAANRQANDLRQAEKRIRSGEQALLGKQEKHRTYIDYLDAEREDLKTLLDWQRAPGFSRSKEINLVALAAKTWNNTFRDILATLKDQHQLTPEQHIDLTNAVAYRLFKGPQTDKIGYWGDMLDVAKRYNLAKSSLFKNRYSRITRRAGKLTAELAEFHETHGK